MLKFMLVYKHFQTRLLIGWQQASNHSEAMLGNLCLLTWKLTWLFHSTQCLTRGVPLNLESQRKYELQENFFTLPILITSVHVLSSAFMGKIYPLGYFDRDEYTSFLEKYKYIYHAIDCVSGWIVWVIEYEDHWTLSLSYISKIWFLL